MASAGPSSEPGNLCVRVLRKMEAVIGRDEWDEFESSSRRGFEQWLRANPDASDAPAVREHLDLRLAEYVKGYRGVLGFVYLVLTPSA